MNRQDTTARPSKRGARFLPTHNASVRQNGLRLAAFNVAATAASALAIFGFIGIVVALEDVTGGVPVGIIMPLLLIALTALFVAGWTRFAKQLDGPTKDHARTAGIGAVPLAVTGLAGSAVITAADVLSGSTDGVGTVVFGLFLGLLAFCAALSCVAVVTATARGREIS